MTRSRGRTLVDRDPEGDSATFRAAERSTRKERTILDAARGVFLERGFLGANMDEVAVRAGASKVTVYKHFADKRSLFEAVVSTAMADAEGPTRTLVERLGASENLEQDLRRFARQHIVDLTQPELLRLRRMIIAEAHRFPDLARRWHRAGPERGHLALAREIGVLAGRGVLRVTDPLLAAQQLNYLIISVPLNEAMFLDEPRIGRRRLHRFADEAVRVFLAAYGS